jgi:hypothetical protein
VTIRPPTPQGPTNPGLDQLDLSGLEVGLAGRVLRVRSPLEACRTTPGSPECAAALARLANPYAIEDDPGAFHTTGWYGAYEAGPSPVAVAVESAEDIAAGVGFARERGLRLVVKGTGHDYLGRSSAPGAHSIWTHPMREVTVHEAFTPTGADPAQGGVPAITVGAGARGSRPTRAPRHRPLRPGRRVPERRGRRRLHPGRRVLHQSENPHCRDRPGRGRKELSLRGPGPDRFAERRRPAGPLDQAKRRDVAGSQTVGPK